MKIPKGKKEKSYKIISNSKFEIKEYSKGDYVRLGDRLRKYNQNDVPDEDLEMLQTLRISYKQPLSEIFDILQKSIQKIDKGAIVTYRVKRITSIISKLLRLNDAQLPRIEDIAGCRCILKNNNDVYKLKDLISKELYIKSDRNDYIANPKPDGYQSLHLIVQTKDKKSKPIEVQLRCEKDHNWATLVEITDLVYNTRIKELGNEKELGNILLLLSRGFNNIKNTELIELIDLIIQKDFVKKIIAVFVKNSIEVRKQWSEIEKRSDRNFYLIQVDRSNKSTINSYDTFNKAEDAYFETFKKNPDFNIVLTHIKNAEFKQISKAYSNYTLTFHEFTQELLDKLKELAKIAYSEREINNFRKYFDIFVFIFFEIAKLQLTEIMTIDKTKCKSKQIMEWRNDIDKRSEKTIKKGQELFKDTAIENSNFFQNFRLKQIKNSIWKKYSEQFTKDISKMEEQNKPEEL